MFKSVTPESVGISSKFVMQFLKTCHRSGIVNHSVIMMRGNSIFAEYYWRPFHKDKVHRMYSQTKSFVGIAIGLLLEDGKLSLDDEIYKFFQEKIEHELPENLKNMTIRDMLSMQTCGETPDWFTHSDPDRTHLYFNENSAIVPSGMRWSYDSPGSQVLSVLVEKLSGMSLFDFLNERIFKYLGTFKDASILKTRNDDSFGDSALLCTTRDMVSFARLLMNGGEWNGRQLISREYVKIAVSKVADNRITAFDKALSQGYGYQIWKTEYNGFGFIGMGDQLTICMPEKDFIFSCTCDNQGYPEARTVILNAVYDLIVENLSDKPLPENKDEYILLERIGSGLELAVMSGEVYSPSQKELSGKEYICQENETGITSFYFEFNDDEGKLHYTNAQGKKTLIFGLGKNVFTKFPQLGYSDIHATLPSYNPDFMYDCAVSAAWGEEKKLMLRVQIIDTFLGNIFMLFSFKDNMATVRLYQS